MIKLLSFLKRYSFMIFIAVLLLFIQAICDLSLPNYMSKIVNEGILRGDITHISKIGMSMILITLISAIANIVVSFLAAKVSANTAQSLRREVFKKVQSFSSIEFNRFSTASLITRTTNDITQIGMIIMMGIRMLCYAPVMGIGGIIMAVSKGASMSFTIVINVALLTLLIIILFFVAVPKFKLIQKFIDKLNLIARENLNGILTVRAFANQKFEENRFDVANNDLTKLNLFIGKVMSLMMPFMMFILNTSSLLIVFVGSHKVSQGSVEIGDMMAFMQYATQIIISFLFISMMFVMVPRSAVSAQRIFEVIDMDIEIKDPEIESESISQKDFKSCQISFENVYFKYSNAEDNVLENINFKIPAGKITAFIGSTGSGKSTIINLIPRFYDVTEGAVKINGINVKEMTKEHLRNLIGYIPQKGILFSGTIASNLRFGDQDASDDDVMKSIKISQAFDFVNEKDEGIEFKIAKGGSNVSGGQKQRLSIARALLKNPPIYIFDDSFSALDFKTDLNLRKELRRYTKNSTVLIVAQRISTIMDADQIIVLDEGKIASIGKHTNLLKSCKVYKEIAESQLSKEELANEQS